MSVTVAAPQELLAVAYAVSGTSTSAASHGAGLSTAWGGSFAVGSRTTVDVEVYIPYMTISAAAGVFVQAHVLVDGTCVAEAFIPHITVGAFTGLGFPTSRRVRLTGLASGVHTVTVQVQVGAGGNTGTIVGSANSPGLLRVVEI